MFLPLTLCIIFYRRLIYIGINASLSEFGVGTYSGADWLKSTDLLVRKKQIKLPGDLREMVYKAASCSYMLKISKNTLFWDTL